MGKCTINNKLLKRDEKEEEVKKDSTEMRMQVSCCNLYIKSRDGKKEHSAQH
jgi:hypothetical protein